MSKKNIPKHSGLQTLTKRKGFLFKIQLSEKIKPTNIFLSQQIHCKNGTLALFEKQAVKFSFSVPSNS